MNSDYIELYPGAIDGAACLALIERFELSGNTQPGRSASGVDRRVKHSLDICIDDHPEWADVVNFLNNAMMGALVRYVRRYPQTMIGPLTLRQRDPASGQERLLDPDAIKALPDAALQKLLAGMFRPGTINLQKYLADQGGYPAWHCENYPQAGDGQCLALHRVLLWSVYLNADFSAGETEFYEQRRAIQPQTGALLIAPAAFTHTHRGNRPVGGDKYIATSWVLFQPAERLFGSA